MGSDTIGGATMLAPHAIFANNPAPPTQTTPPKPPKDKPERSKQTLAMSLLLLTRKHDPKPPVKSPRGTLGETGKDANLCKAPKCRFLSYMGNSLPP